MPRKSLILLNCLLLVYLFIVLSQLPFTAGEEMLRYAKDAREYLLVRYEFFDTQAQGFSSTRPFLYPLFLRIFYGIGGAYGVWIAQLILWLLSANLIWLAIKRFTGSIVFSLIGVVFFVTNFTLITLTFHGLTELITVFFLSWLLYVLADREQIKQVSWMLKALALVAALLLIKPLFSYPFYFALAAALILYGKQLWQKPRFIIYLALIISPVIFQYTMMKIKYDKWELSEISDLTLRKYFVAQGYEYMDNLNRKDAIKKAMGLTKDELREQLSRHYSEYKFLFLRNVDENIAGEPYYLNISKKLRHKGFYDYQLNRNKGYGQWLNVILILSIIAFIHQLWKRTFWQNCTLYLSTVLLFYMVYASGISFYQGDRLTVSALPLGIFSLIGLIYYGWSQAFPRRQEI